MSKKIVRSSKNVTNIEEFSKKLLDENDIVSTNDGKVYIVTKNGLLEIGNHDTDKLKKEIASLKTKNTKLEKRIKALETPSEKE